MAKKIIIWIIVLLVVAAGIYLLYPMLTSKTPGEPMVPTGRVIAPLGSWTLVSDQKHILTFTQDDRYTEVYDGDMIMATGTWTVGEEDGGATIVLTTDGKGAEANRTWKVNSISPRQLEVTEISGSGAKIRFIKERF